MFDRVWKFVLESGEEERHFNELQSRYRALASTWLLATFGAAGFVLTSRNISVPFDAWLLIAFVGLMGAIGMLLLWDLDLLVYQSLLSAYFREALNLELQYPWLPPVRQRMMSAHGWRGVRPKVVWFYVLGSGATVGVSAIGFYGWASTIDGRLAAAGAAIYALVLLAIARWLRGQATIEENPRSGVNS